MTEYDKTEQAYKNGYDTAIKEIEALKAENERLKENYKWLSDSYNDLQGVVDRAYFESVKTLKEITKLKAENAELKGRLSKAVELPCEFCRHNIDYVGAIQTIGNKDHICILPRQTKANYCPKCGRKIEAAEARLKELKKGGNNGIL